jgi:hypothetical protein
MKQQQPSIYAAMAEFETPEALLEAGNAMRQRGYTRLDALTPFAVHGIEDALGMGRSKLGYICITAGALGVLTAVTLQWWVGSINYPLIIGGKPLFAIWPSIPVTFELMVLFASFGAVLGMLALNKLPSLYHPAFNYSRARRATDDRFILVVDAGDPLFSAETVRRDLESVGGQHVELVEE